MSVSTSVLSDTSSLSAVHMQTWKYIVTFSVFGPQNSKLVILNFKRKDVKFKLEGQNLQKPGNI